jgi:hypothetical protein
MGHSIVTEREQVNESSEVVLQSRPTLCFWAYVFFLIHTKKVRNKGWLWWSAQYQASSGHCIGYSIVTVTNLEKEWTQPTEVQIKPRSTPCYLINTQSTLQSLFVVLNTYTPKGWKEVHMFTNPITVWFRPLHTIRGNTTIKTNTVWVYVFFLIHTMKVWNKGWLWWSGPYRLVLGIV